MTTIERASTPLHALRWTQSASGLSIRTRYRGLHVSVWCRPQGGPYHFTLKATGNRLQPRHRSLCLLCGRRLCQTRSGADLPLVLY